MVAAIFSIVVVSPAIINNFLLLVTIGNAVTLMNAITLIQNYKWFLFAIIVVSIVGFPYFIVDCKNNKKHSNIETRVVTIHNKMQPYMDSFIQMLLSLIRTIINYFEYINGFYEIDYVKPEIDNSWCNVDETNIISGKRPRITRNYTEDSSEESEESDDESFEESDDESFEESDDESFEEREFSGEQLRRLRIHNPKNDNETEDEYLNRLVVMAEEEDKKALVEVLTEVLENITTDVKTEVETEVKTEVETEVKTEVETEVKTEVETEVKTEVETEVKTEVENEVKTEVETEVKTEVENEVKTEVETETRHSADSDEDAYTRAKEVSI
jgi:DNA polymerase III gamma/tau subunit